MRVLIVEDDFVGRRVLHYHLSKFGPCDYALDGVEAVEAVRVALKGGEPYDLICLDIMMPNMDGHAALKRIRQLEAEAGFSIGTGSKILMVTALSDKGNVLQSFMEKSDGYLVKPIDVDQLLGLLRQLDLIGD